MKEIKQTAHRSQTAAELLAYIKQWEGANAAFLSRLSPEKRQQYDQAREHVEERISKEKARKRRAFTVIQGGRA